MFGRSTCQRDLTSGTHLGEFDKRSRISTSSQNLNQLASFGQNVLNILENEYGLVSGSAIVRVDIGYQIEWISRSTRRSYRLNASLSASNHNGNHASDPMSMRDIDSEDSNPAVASSHQLQHAYGGPAANDIDSDDQGELTLVKKEIERINALDQSQRNQWYPTGCGYIIRPFLNEVHCTTCIYIAAESVRSDHHANMPDSLQLRLLRRYVVWMYVCIRSLRRRISTGSVLSRAASISLTWRRSLSFNPCCLVR